MANVRGFGDLAKDNNRGGGGPPGGGGGMPPGSPGMGGGGFPGGFPGLGGGGHGEGPVDHKNVHEVHSEEEYQKELNMHGPQALVVVDFYADWCGPCKGIAPVYAQLSEEFKNVRFLKVNVDQLNDVAGDAGVRAIPAFHFFKGGKKVDELSGADPSKLKSIIQKHASGSTVKGAGGGFQGTGHRLGDPSPSLSQPVHDVEQLSENDQILLVTLLDYGFSQEHCAKAIAATNSAGVEEAVEWLLANPEAPTITTTTASTTTTTPSSVPASGGGAVGEEGKLARINFRLPGGETKQHQFPETDTLHTLINFLRSSVDRHARFELSTTFPRKVFGGDDLNKTLRQLDLAPSATVIVVKK